MERILVICNSSSGLYGFRKHLLAKLIESNNTVYVATAIDSDAEFLTSIGCIVIETPMERRTANIFKEQKLIKHYKKIIKKVNPTKVITYTIKPNIFGGNICRKNKIPYYANVSGLGTAFQKSYFFKKIIIYLYRKAFLKANTVFFENGDNAKYFIDQRIIREEQSCVLNGAGVDLEHFVFIDYPENDSDVFLFIGRVMKEKGVDEFIDSARKIKLTNPNVEFHIVGHYEENYKDIIEELNNEGTIIYHGRQNDVRPFIAKCTALILPSYHEGMANVLLEAAACGRPLITSDIPGCREAVRGNENGILVKAKSADSLYFGLKSFIEKTHKEKSAMGQASRIYMEENFDKKEVVKNTLAKIK